MNTFINIYIYWSSTVPGDKWQYRGVIDMFFICQRNVESMTKQWHTLYGYAVRPEKGSWTSPCRVSLSFSSTIYSSLSTTRPRTSGPQSMSTTNLESSGIYKCQWRYLYLARRGKGNSLLLQLKMVMCFASESFILFIPSLHCFLNLMGSFTLVNMNVDMNHLLT